MKPFYFLLLILLGFPCEAQIVTIPDANFKACLVSNALIDTNNDGEVQVAEAENYTGTLNCSSQGITDATGIEAFINVSIIVLTNNALGALDLSGNESLVNFTCDGCDISSLNFGTIQNVETIFITFYSFTTIDLSSLVNLESLIMSYGPLIAIDVSASINLDTLHLDAVDLIDLDVSGMTSLESLWLQQNTLTSLDLTGCTSLKTMQMYQSGLTDIDFSTNTALENLNLTQSLLTSLDLSMNLNIIDLNIGACNGLETVLLASGNNSAIVDLDARSCDNLVCIEVDSTIDILNPPAGWFLDSIDDLSYDCSAAPVVVDIPDANLKSCLLSNPDINTNGDNEIQLSEATAFDGFLNCGNMGIVNTSGIEQIIFLEGLQLSQNQIETIDVSNFGAMNILSIGSNPLQSLDVTSNTLLTAIDIRNTSVSSLDITFNIALTNLVISNTPITTIDMSQNVLLRNFNAQESSLETIDFSENGELETIRVNDTQIAALDVSMLPLLEGLVFSNNAVTEIDLSENLLLEYIYGDGNLLQDVDLSNNPELIEVVVDSNNLLQLNIANGTNSSLLYLMNAQENPNLTCIQVDADIDVNNPPIDWVKDPGTQYSDDCGYLEVDEVKLESMMVYPNPTSNKINVLSQSPLEELQLMDSLGKIIMTSTTSQLDLSKLSSGMYFLLIKSNNYDTIKRIIKN